MTTAAVGRPTVAVVDLGAVAHNAAALVARIGDADLCAVVKADGYGHGAVQVADAARRGGATWLAVAMVDEGARLRRAGQDLPVLVLAEPGPDEIRRGLDLDLVPTVCTDRAISTCIEWAEASGRSATIHLKVDTGMRRMGAEPADAVRLASRIASARGLRLGGTWTHLACADDLGSSTTPRQLAVFGGVLDAMRDAGIDPGIVHAANSAAALASPGARFDMVRCGITLYGLVPGPALADLMAGDGVPPELRFRTAMSLSTEVTAVRRVPAGSGVSYGHLGVTDRPATIATLPIGYADGLPRRAGTSGAEVLIGGQRLPLIGVVTMDQCMVDCGDHPVSVGDEAAVFGATGAPTADELAARLGTIGYEIVCGVSGRVPRTHVGA